MATELTNSRTVLKKITLSGQQLGELKKGKVKAALVRHGRARRSVEWHCESAGPRHTVTCPGLSDHATTTPRHHVITQTARL